MCPFSLLRVKYRIKYRFFSFEINIVKTIRDKKKMFEMKVTWFPEYFIIKKRKKFFDFFIILLYNYIYYIIK